MEQTEYSEEELLGKKYNELFKISKALGIKTARRLKTDKLIEAILKCQREEVAAEETAEKTSAEESLLQEAEAVVEALGSGTQGKEEEEELLLDVQFPECGSQESLDSLSGSNNTSSEAPETLTGQETSKEPTPAKRHKRSGTYDVEEEEKELEKIVEWEEERANPPGNKKRRLRSIELDLLTASTNVTLPVDEKEAEENTNHFSHLLASKVTVRGSRRHGTPTTTTTNTAATPATQGKGDGRSTPRLSLTPAAKRLRRSVTITPSAPAPTLRPSRKSRGTPVASPAPTKPNTVTTTTSKTSHSNTTTSTTTAMASKPVFNIGRGDKKANEGATQDDKQGGKGASSGIPRFLSYARRLKVPDFARIHNKAFQRMEGLDDYVDKRKARHDTLDSTAKKHQSKTNVFQPSVTDVKKLNFNFAEEASTVNSSSISNGAVQSEDVVPIAPSPSEPQRLSPKSAKRTSTITKGTRVTLRATRYSVKPGKEPVSSTKPVLARKSTRVPSKSSPKSIKQVSPKTVPGQKTSPKRSQKKSPQIDRKSQMSQGSRLSIRPVSSKKVSTIGVPVFGLPVKENQKPGKASLASPMVSKLQSVSGEASSPASVRKRMQDYSQSLASRGTAYVPYKGPVKPLKDRNELKNMAERKHKVKTSKEIREGQRGILKGVRLNKRFELQMANRGITL